MNMADTIQRNILDPKTTFSSWSVFISLLIVISWAIFWISGLQNQTFNNQKDNLLLKEAIAHNTIAIENLPGKFEEKLKESLEANNDNLVLALDERYQKKN